MNITVTVPSGYRLVLTMDAYSTGYYVRTDDGQGTPVAIAESGSATLGAFNDTRTYLIYSDTNPPSYSLDYYGIFTSSDSLEVDGKQDAFTPEAFQADLAVDANGTAIATAVNGLRDTLVTLGLMEPEPEV